MVEFISYDGAFPNLCGGELVLRIDGEIVSFGRYCLSSGGWVSFNDDWDGTVEGKAIKPFDLEKHDARLVNDTIDEFLNRLARLGYFVVPHDLIVIQQVANSVKRLDGAHD